VIRLVVGLGNPGPDYEGTRHNVGFEVVDRLAREEGLLFNPGRKLEGYSGPGAFSWARLERLRALLIKPETYMNRSGAVVAPLARWTGGWVAEESGAAPNEGATEQASEPGTAQERIPDHVMVVYDDLDLDLGKLRIRPHGGHGGHNGMRSIMECLDSDRFPRLRVGIGPARADAARYVLERFSPKETVDAEISVAEAAEAALDWLKTGDLEGCMTRFHSRWNQGA
jgi:PTH1 family peptidyl-tRNA hydrolase